MIFAYDGDFAYDLAWYQKINKVLYLVTQEPCKIRRKRCKHAHISHTHQHTHTHSHTHSHTHTHTHICTHIFTLHT